MQLKLAIKLGQVRLSVRRLDLRRLSAGLLAGLYAVLYVLVRAEDTALLMGSVALFALLAAVMVGTRRVDWYAVEVPTEPRAAGAGRT